MATLYSPAHDVADLIAEAGLGFALGTDLFVGILPPEPDEAVACIDQVGSIVGRDLTTGEYMRAPSVQVLVRGNTLNEAWTQAETIRQNLYSPGTISGRSRDYTGIGEEGDMIRVGRDENGRERFSLNYTLTREI